MTSRMRAPSADTCQDEVRGMSYTYSSVPANGDSAERTRVAASTPGACIVCADRTLVRRSSAPEGSPLTFSVSAMTRSVGGRQSSSVLRTPRGDGPSALGAGSFLIVSP